MTLTDEQDSKVLAFITQDTDLKPSQVANTVLLLREGATVPFIARYRKERTGELDEVQIRAVEERYVYFSDLEERKGTVLKAIAAQGKLTPELQGRIDFSRLKSEVEDLYLPFRPKRRTKAIIARERGLEPLADLILRQEGGSVTPEQAAAPFVDPEKELPDVAAALAGAGHIIAERIADDADGRAFVRRLTAGKGVLTSRVAADKRGEVTKYELYYEYREPLRDVPSHRLLAMRRGEKEEVLYLGIEAPVDEILEGLRRRVVTRETLFTPFLRGVVADSYQRLIAPSLEVELRLVAKERADEAAIRVFAGNMENLLMAPPAGAKRVLGVDPGIRTGSKLATVDATGRFLEHATIYPLSGPGRIPEAKRQILHLVESHRIEMVAVGNGTAGRETELFMRETLAEGGVAVPVVLVNEAGASVYSASEIAREEFPELDLTIRGAVSIARRLQDPLAELVKIDPKSIGVGQYQHDVNQAALKRSLDAVVESCVNRVGVDLNTASWALLAHVSGISEGVARAITRHRDEHGPFPSRRALLQVPRFGAKAFEQAAGFLRIREGVNPLDATVVHPERYSLVERMAADLRVSVAELVSSPEFAERIEPSRYLSAEVGLPTVNDIVAELKKPGRDPRQEFRTAAFRDDVRELGDLREGMILQGVVTNVTAFGAFVDVGVHQDGLVHVSHLARRFVRDPHAAVKVGELVTVKVIAVDERRRRIALSIREALAGAENQRLSPPPGG